MPLFSPEFRAASARRDVAPIPVFDAAWPAPFGASRYSDRPRGFLSGIPAQPLLLEAPSITYDAGLTPGNLTMTEISVVLADKDRQITRILEGGVDPRGSACSLSYALDGLDEADWHVLATGIFDHEEYQDAGRSIALHFRPNDTPFRGSLPKKQILKSECSLALPSSFGLFYPLLYGEHDASAITGKGMVPCVNVNYAASDWLYAVCLGWAFDVPRVYKNGLLQVLSSEYVIRRQIIGGALITVIAFLSAPGEDAVITCDAQGYETVGDGSGTLMLNPVDQLLHLLVNFGFGDYRYSQWKDSGSAPLDLASFAISSAFAARSKLEGGFRIGGTAETQTVQDVLAGWLKSDLPFRAYPTTEGKLALRPLDHKFGGYTAGTLFARGQVDEIGETFKPSRDTSQIVRRVDCAFIFDSAQGKFTSSLAIQDVSQTEQVGAAYDFLWAARKLV